MFWLLLFFICSSSYCCADDASNGEFSKSKKRNVIVSQFVLPITLDMFERMFVSDTASLSIEDFHRKSMDQNIQLSKWLPTPSSKKTLSSSTREVMFLRPIRGMASTRAIKIQNYTRIGKYGSILLSTTKLKDVPGADTFSVDESMTIRPIGAHSVSLQVSWELQWLRETFFKSLIESNTNNEMKKWQTAYVNTMLEHCKQTSPVAKLGVRPSNGSTKRPSSSFSLMPSPSSSIEHSHPYGQAAPVPPHGDSCLLRRRIWFPKMSFNTLCCSRRGFLF